MWDFILFDPLYIYQAIEHLQQNIKVKFNGYIHFFIV